MLLVSLRGQPYSLGLHSGTVGSWLSGRCARQDLHAKSVPRNMSQGQCQESVQTQET